MSNSIATGVAYQDPEFTTCYASSQLGTQMRQWNCDPSHSAKQLACCKRFSWQSPRNMRLGAGATKFVLTNSTLSAKDTLIAILGQVALLGFTGLCCHYTGTATMVVQHTAFFAEAVTIKLAIIHAVV
jgi:hypothetical protein